MSEETTNLNSDGLSVDNGVDVIISGTQQLILDGDEASGLLKEGEAVPVEEPQEEPQAEPTAEPQVALNDKIDKHTKTLDALGKDLKAKGVDFNQAIKEYNEYGALSSKTMADLAQAGYPAESLRVSLNHDRILRVSSLMLSIVRQVENRRTTRLLSGLRGTSLIRF